MVSRTEFIKVLGRFAGLEFIENQANVIGDEKYSRSAKSWPAG